MPNYFFEINATNNDKFMSRFMYNAEPIIWSQPLTTKASAKTNIASIKDNACQAIIIDVTKGETSSDYRFEIFETTDKQYMVRFIASNDETVAVSESYTAKHNAIKAAESVRDNSANAEIRDNTLPKAA